ncbi:MAG: hypothetical protein QFX33_00705 [Candidatus Nezhaarchaeota archaeon]|nr:hypothetical protein [Candidatus Nezhaarchaeota archaeon]
MKLKARKAALGVLLVAAVFALLSSHAESSADHRYALTISSPEPCTLMVYSEGGSTVLSSRIFEVYPLTLELPKGRYTLFAATLGGVAEVFVGMVDLEADARVALEFAPPPSYYSRNVSISVVYPNGSPAAGFEVSAYAKDSRIVISTAKTNEAGRAQLAVVDVPLTFEVQGPPSPPSGDQPTLHCVEDAVETCCGLTLKLHEEGVSSAALTPSSSPGCQPQRIGVAEEGSFEPLKSLLASAGAICASALIAFTVFLVSRGRA